jgi:hypothetical protein
LIFTKNANFFAENWRKSIVLACPGALLTSLEKTGNLDSMLWMRLQMWQSSRTPEMIAVDLGPIS